MNESPNIALAVEHVSRRRFLSAMGSAALATAFLAACGDDEATGTPSTSASTPAASPAPATATATTTGATTGTGATDEAIRLFPLPPGELGAPDVPAPSASTAAEPTPYASIIDRYADYGTDAAPGEFPRVIRHAFGETTLDARPERVVVLDRSELETAILLGVQPVGVMEGNFPAYMGDAVGDAVRVGASEEPDIEAIAALSPDLILLNATDHDQAMYDLLSEVAPTIFAYWTGVAWKHNFALYAQALGREAEAGEVIRQYEERVRALNEALPSPRPSLSLIRVRTDHLRYMQRANFAGVLLDDFGFPRPPLQNVDDFGLNNMSLETVGEYAPADLIVVAIDGGAENEFGRDLLASPLWQSLKAVQNGNVLVADQTVWIAGIGYLAAHAVMDDLEHHFGLA